LKGYAGLEDNLDANKRSRGIRGLSADATGAKGVLKNDNDWIPTDAVRCIMRIKDQFKAQMTETAVS
jgi:hypothetical protein